MNGISASRITLAPLLVIAGCLLVAAPAMSAEKQEKQQAEYVGQETCAGCHEDAVKAFKRNLHSKAGRWVDGFMACESCHGPGGEHASTMDKTKIKNPARMEAGEASATCLGCHRKGKVVHWDRSMHGARGMSCLNCHSIHKGHKKFLKKADQKDLCFECHIGTKAEINKRSHHPVREGKITCSDCHNPHGTIAPKMISANTINEKCYECHAEKRGPMLWEHRPVVEDCTICHKPHGSTHRKLLARKLPYLCQACHSQSHHPSGLYAIDPSSPGTTAQERLSYRVLYRACITCHPAIHGSNHPSGPRFTR